MTFEAPPLFSEVMTLRPVPGSAGHFDAELGEHWTIGPKPHGGVMIALCANAARSAYSEGGADPAAYPIAVSANYLSAPDPGAVRLVTGVRKRGRRIGLVDVELIQGDRACVHAVVTLGEPEHNAPPLFSHTPVTELMSPDPPAGVVAIGPGHPAAEINNLSRGCDIRPLVVESVSAGVAPTFQIWVRPKVGRVDELFALMCGDISLPVPYAVGRRGWAPTVQLTAYLRGVPADGWLRVVCTTTEIGRDWFDEDHTVVDSTGRIVVQTRQLALVPGL
ncbi:MAG: thioesterase family protein [Mycobacterium sp.]